MAPLSRGSVTIASADTDDLPIVNPNLLAHPADKALILAGFKRARQLSASKSVQIAAIGKEAYPGSRFRTDEEILEAISEAAMTVWHASCTCKMGKVNDSTAVIDTQGRVIGVQRLRVVDASSFPLLPPGHPQSTVCGSNYVPLLILGWTLTEISTDALAEKIADDIKLEYSLES